MMKYIEKKITKLDFLPDAQALSHSNQIFDDLISFIYKSDTVISVLYTFVHFNVADFFA